MYYSTESAVYGTIFHTVPVLVLYFDHLKVVPLGLHIALAPAGKITGTGNATGNATCSGQHATRVVASKRVPMAVCEGV